MCGWIITRELIFSGISKLVIIRIFAVVLNYVVASLVAQQYLPYCVKCIGGDSYMYVRISGISPMSLVRRLCHAMSSVHTVKQNQ